MSKRHVKVCVVCDEEFETTYSKKIFCSKTHIVKCEFCGENYEATSKVINRSKYRGCSKAECVTKLRSISTSGVKKARNFKKNCVICNQEFDGIHHQVLCNNKECEVEYTRIEKRRSYLEYMEKRGPIIRNCPICNEDFHAVASQVYCKPTHTRICKICNCEYEESSVYYRIGAPVCNNKECRNTNFKETMMKRYGVPHQMHVDSIVKKVNATNRERYGVDWTTQSEQMKEASIATNIERYGAPHIFMNEEMIVKAGIKYKSDKDFIDFVKANKGKYTRIELSEVLGYKDGNAGGRVKELGLEDYVVRVTSQHERDMSKFLDSLGVHYIQDDRTKIYPLEIDFYIPEFNLGIEISPTSTHNTYKGIYNGKPKDKNYHLRKFELAKQAGVQLITVFDWHNLDMIYEKIKRKLGLSTEVNIEDLTYSEVKLDDNIVKTLSSWYVDETINEDNIVGIVKNDNELISVIEYEVNKECIKVNQVSIKPGFTLDSISKYLIEEIRKENITCNRIEVISDDSLQSGETLENLGFTVSKSLPPVKTYFNEALNTISSDNSVNVSDDTMYTDGFLPIYDCGYRLWSYAI